MPRAAPLALLATLLLALAPPAHGGPSAPSYSTLLGGSGLDGASAVAVGPDGSLFVAGTTDSTDFPGATATPRGWDVFVMKLSPDGTQVRWTRLLGGTGYDSASAMEVAQDGSVYVAGETTSRDFPVQGVAVFGRAPGGERDGFLFRLDANGGLAWSEYVGGSGDDSVADLQIDGRGRIVLVGTSTSCDLPTYELSYRPTNPMCGRGQPDAFVLRFWNDGALNRGTFFGGAEADFGYGVAVSQSSGSVMLVGKAMSPGLATPGALRTTSDGDDAFLAKLDEGLERLLFATYLGGSAEDDAFDVARDGDGNAYVVGSTRSTDFPTTPAAYQQTHQSPRGCELGGPDPTPRACSDGFVAKVTPDGARLAYGTFLGSLDEDAARSVAVDTGRGVAWVAGSVGNGGQIDGFVASFTPDGALATMELARGTAFDEAKDVELYQGRAFAAGATSSPDFVTSPDAPDRTAVGDEAFLVRIGDAPAPGSFTASFTNVKGNAWWIEAKVTGSERIVAVAASVNGGAWRPLDLQWWGHWAKSYSAPSGSIVRLQATSASGATALSPCYQWTAATVVACPGAPPPPPPPAGSFTATFSNVRGNEWWVETDVAPTGGTLAGVDARVNGGAWVALDLKSWGSWAKSIHAPPGSAVEFRARATDGQTSTSATYSWPPA